MMLRARLRPAALLKARAAGASSAAAAAEPSAAAAAAAAWPTSKGSFNDGDWGGGAISKLEADDIEAEATGIEATADDC